MEECRLCGSKVPKENIKIRLYSDIQGFVNAKSFIEYFLRINLDDNKQFPDSVCRQCFSKIVKFCLFTTEVESVQNKFKNRLPPDDDQRQVVQETSESVVQETSRDISKETISSASSSTSRSKRKMDSSIEETSSDGGGGDEKELRKSKRMKTGGKMAAALSEIKYSDKRERVETTLCEALLETQDLFKDDLKKSEKNYITITINKNLLDKETGEIPESWLANFSSYKTWTDFTYQCVTHCQQKFKSLKKLLDHYDELKISQHKRNIKCTECPKKYCDQSNNLTLYLNHMARKHELEFLKFTCFLCDKSKVFVNMVKLVQHMILAHPTRKLKLFPCFDCGLMFYAMDKLATHKKSQHNTHEKS